MKLVSYIFVILLLALLPHCKAKRPVANANSVVPGVVVHAKALVSSKATQVVALSAFEAPIPVRGDQIKVTGLSIATQSLADYNMPLVTVDLNDATAYYEIAVCNQENFCQPGKDAPLQFPIPPFQITDPPFGIITLFVRGCANTNHLIDRSVPCGEWISTTYNQTPTHNEATRLALLDVDKKTQIVQKAGFELQEIVKNLPNSTQMGLADSNPNAINYQSLKSSFQNLSPQLLGSLIASDYFLSVVNNAVQMEQQASQTGLALVDGETPAKLPSFGSLALLSLGSPDVLGLHEAQTNAMGLAETYQQLMGRKMKIIANETKIVHSKWLQGKYGDDPVIVDQLERQLNTQTDLIGKFKAANEEWVNNALASTHSTPQNLKKTMDKIQKSRSWSEEVEKNLSDKYEAYMQNRMIPTSSADEGLEHLTQKVEKTGNYILDKLNSLKPKTKWTVAILIVGAFITAGVCGSGYCGSPKSDKNASTAQQLIDTPVPTQTNPLDTLFQKIMQQLTDLNQAQTKVLNTIPK